MTEPTTMLPVIGQDTDSDDITLHIFNQIVAELGFDPDNIPNVVISAQRDVIDYWERVDYTPTARELTVLLTGHTLTSFTKAHSHALLGLLESDQPPPHSTLALQVPSPGLGDEEGSGMGAEDPTLRPIPEPSPRQQLTRQQAKKSRKRR